MVTADDLSVEGALNPLTAPACKMSGLNDARTRLQTVYFPFLCMGVGWGVREAGWKHE